MMICTETSACQARLEIALRETLQIESEPKVPKYLLHVTELQLQLASSLYLCLVYSNNFLP